jgi:FKBP-type peptidyl-prolyl cis-trans isomerase
VLAPLTLNAIACAQQPTPATQPSDTNKTQPTTKPSLQESYRTVSYGIGLRMGQSLKELPFPADHELLRAGLEDAMNGRPQRISDEQLMEAEGVVRAELSRRQAEEAKAALESEKARGLAFREANGKKPGVKSLPSGVQIETLVEGTGASPKGSDRVKVHYTGQLIDGRTFDSSRDPDGTGGEPVSFVLNEVIPGWTEGVQQMKVGGKSRLVIPPELAYRDRGAPPVIPGGATLVFEVELLEILPPESAEPATQPAR